MARFGLLIDVTKCTGCHNCFLACRDEYYGNDYSSLLGRATPRRPVLDAGQGDRARHLSQAEARLRPAALPALRRTLPAWTRRSTRPCTGARTASCSSTRRRPRARSPSSNACPYRVIFWNEELRYPQKCTMCAHRLDEGEKVPRCVEACPTTALIFGDLDDPRATSPWLLAAAKTEDYHPEYGAAAHGQVRGHPQALRRR